MKPLIVTVLLAAAVSGCAPDTRAPEGTPTPVSRPADETPPPAPAPPATLPPPAEGSSPTTVVPPSPIITPAPAPTTGTPLDADLQQVLDQWLELSGAPGAALGMRLPDGSTSVALSGETDDAGGFPLEPGHRFRIGSITKTFVAVLLVQLAQEGLLSLDDRLADHLPDAPHAEHVTIRQLLDHTSGMPDFGAVAAYRIGLLGDPARTWDPEDVLALIAERALSFAPGTNWAYSNTNYTLLGMIAEKVADRPLAELLRRRISEPLSLESTYLESLERAPPVETAGHYDIDGDGRAENVRVIPYTALVTSGAAAGGLNSNALDVLDFASGVFDGELLSRQSLAELTTPPEVYPGYALGLAIFERDGRQYWGHAGALPGYTALLAYAPAQGVTVVALVNQSGVDVQSLAEDSFELAEAQHSSRE